MFFSYTNFQRSHNCFFVFCFNLFICKSIIVMNSIDTRFSRNVFEAVQKTRSTCFIGSKTTRLRLVVLNTIKYSCSFPKHYLCHSCIRIRLCRQGRQLSQPRTEKRERIRIRASFPSLSPTHYIRLLVLVTYFLFWYQ